MFFFKKKNSQTPPVVNNENVAKKTIKTMDTVVTGMILGGIIASIYGVKKLRTKDKKPENPSSSNDHH